SIVDLQIRIPLSRNHIDYKALIISYVGSSTGVMPTNNGVLFQMDGFKKEYL
ncbi:2862_t:CDS:1, partial [Entrophospora sp. SA101]